MEIKNIMNSSVEALYKIYDELNKKYYNSSLPEVMITIQDSKGKYYGWFSSRRWVSMDVKPSEQNTDPLNSAVHEINITPEHLTRPIENICATMNHEMVHLYCFLNDIQDTSTNGKYHNKKFKKEAEERGLIISKAPGIGWSKTEPTESFIEFVNTLGLENAFPYFRVSIPSMSNAASTASQKKYVCPSCGIKLRGKTGLHIICGDCEVNMIEE